MTSRRTDGGLSRDHHVPLRRQLAADLEAGIRDGHLRPGSPLPSTRDLAQYLEVDRGTVSAAMARLRRRRLVDAGPGCRPRVRDPYGPLPRFDMDVPHDHVPGDRHGRGQMRRALARTMRWAFAAGISRDRLLRELETASRVLRSTSPVTLFDPRPGLARALAAELDVRCGVEVRPVAGLRQAPPDRPLLLRQQLLDRLPRSLHLECLPISLAGGTRERGVVRRRVRQGLVVLVSVSGTVRGYAEELAAAEFRSGVSFVTVDPDDDMPCLIRTLGAARLIFTDFEAAGRLPEVTAHLLPVHLLPRREIAKISGYLRAEPSRTASDGPGVAVRSPDQGLFEETPEDGLAHGPI